MRRLRAAICAPSVSRQRGDTRYVPALSGGTARLAAQASPQEQAAPAPAPASKKPHPLRPQTSPATIKKESRLVLVDAVVTDKKGNYIRDLATKDFKILRRQQRAAGSPVFPPARTFPCKPKGKNII